MEKQTQNKSQRTFLLIGIVLLIAGILFAALGAIDFVKALGAKISPTKLWCVFLAFPLLGIGGGLTAFGVKKSPPSSKE